MIGYHYYTIHQIKKQTAIDILDTLHEYEKETQPDTLSETGVPVFSYIKWSRRSAIMDCEMIVYERYKLWE